MTKGEQHGRVIVAHFRLVCRGARVAPLRALGRGFARTALNAAIVVVAIAAVTAGAITVLAAGEGRARAAGPEQNACGCYRDQTGSCFCTKKAKCGCPGDCEPKGCEEKRAKQLEKEIEAETKRATSGKGGKAAKGGGESDDGSSSSSSGKGASSSDGDASSDANKKPGKKLSTAQKKELAKLIDAYLAEHPDHGKHSLAQVRDDLGQ